MDPSLWLERITANKVKGEQLNEWKALSKGDPDFPIIWDGVTLLTWLLTTVDKVKICVAIDRWLREITGEPGSPTMTDSQVIRILEACLVFVEVAGEIRESKNFKDAVERMKQKKHGGI